MISHIMVVMSLSVFNTGIQLLSTTTPELQTKVNTTEVIRKENQKYFFNPTESFKHYLSYSTSERFEYSIQDNLEQSILAVKAEEEEKIRLAKEAETKRKKEEEAKKKAAELARQEAAKQKSNSNLASNANNQSVTELIRYWTNHYGVSYDMAIKIARCESGLNPSVVSKPTGLYVGVFQQDRNFWPNRAANAGLPGASIFDAEANVRVSIYMMATDGFFHWPVCSK